MSATVAMSDESEIPLSMVLATRRLFRRPLSDSNQKFSLYKELVLMPEMVCQEIREACGGLQNESYTSKNRPWDGTMDEKLGSTKVIRGNGFEVDRDINAARGILIKHNNECCVRCVFKQEYTAVISNTSYQPKVSADNWC